MGPWTLRKVIECDELLPSITLHQSQYIHSNNLHYCGLKRLSNLLGFPTRLRPSDCMARLCALNSSDHHMYLVSTFPARNKATHRDASFWQLQGNMNRRTFRHLLRYSAVQRDYLSHHLRPVLQDMAQGLVFRWLYWYIRTMAVNSKFGPDA